MNHCAVRSRLGAARTASPLAGAGAIRPAAFSRRLVPTLLLIAMPWFGAAYAQTGVVAPPLPTGQATASQSAAAEANTTEFKLSNGMRVIVKEDHRAPTVAHQIWYRAGGMDEVSGTTGVAHMLEHMMFKGTPKVGPGEFSKQIAALGGRENALTNRDFTLYYQQISKQYLPRMMELEADRMANLIIKKDEFEREMKVVMEERRLRTDDSARGTVYEQLLATVFTAAPYRHPVIGWPADLVNMRVEDVQAWYKNWYVPDNALLVVTGDVTAAEVRTLAERIYGKLKARPLPLRKDQVEPVQKGIKRIWVKAPAENPYIVMAYKVPRLHDVEKDVDPYALEVLSAVLNGYDNARLTRDLVRERRIADDVNVGYDSINRGESIMVLDGTPANGHTTEEIERALRDEIARIAREGVSPEELKRVKAQVVAAQIYKRDSVFGQGMEIGVAEISGISWRKLDRMLEKIKEVTPAQVQAVAGKYFNDDNLTVATLLPQPIDPNKPKAPVDSGSLR
ncbi:M16 family metallopeptidase [Cupriavidus basilensis]|uniref:M16 family metallopeptidase n=1 Tax=Cupriavidus basilensis TaxID=68895 RepID=UPI0023E81AFF|nr:pitrilysin family protein [Cupriavidus basilensis]MDF3883785.1 pitrilysin family protein [Cupriavidus basilensis]